MISRQIIKFNIWQKEHLSEVYLLYILALIIGLLAGLSSFLLKSIVHRIDIFVSNFSIDNGVDLLYLIMPGIGIMLTWLLFKYIIKDETKHGIPRILYVISRLDGKMKYHKVFSSMLGGALTAGFGGSVGLESPIISSGASYGSGVGQFFRLNFKTRTLLIGCGAAGAIASIFTTPVAAVIFSLEVLMLDLTTASIIPLLIASAAGAITSKMLAADAILFNFSSNSAFQLENLPYYILLGILSGLISLYFSHMHFKISALFKKLKSRTLIFTVGFVSLGLLIFLFPPLYGEGYDIIRLIIDGKADAALDQSFFAHFSDNTWVLLLFFSLLIFLKVIATSITIEAGGIGGIFAPSAITGGMLGFVFARFTNLLRGSDALNEGNFTLVGMSAVLAAILHAPLTAMFLIVEMTNGYSLIVPLMITISIAYITNKKYSSHSIFHKELADSGDLITHHKDKSVLTLLQVKHVIDRDLKIIAPQANLEDLIHLIAGSKRNIFPVVDESGIYHGLVDLDDVRKDMFDLSLRSRPISDYIMQAKEHVSLMNSMEEVMEKFKKTGYYNLPVIHNNKYIGFVSRANIFTSYRKILNELSDE